MASPKFTMLDGWVLDSVGTLDVLLPGVAGHFLRASSERRQVAAAYLSGKFDSDLRLEDAKLLVNGRHEAILEAAYGRVPRGLRGALSRSGEHPHERPYYQKLFQALDTGTQDRAAIALRQLRILSPAKLNIATLLPRELCSVKLVETLRDETEADDLLALLPKMIAHGAQKYSLFSSLREVSDKGLYELLSRWSFRLTFGDGPLRASSSYQPVRSGRELRGLAARYRNCAKTYIADAVSGLASFGVFELGGISLIIHCSRRSDSWILDGIYAERNRPVPRAAEAAAVAYAQSHGIDWAYNKQRAAREWKLMRRALRSTQERV